MKKIFLTDFLDDEYWYGGIVSQGDNFPLNKESIWSFDLSINETVNQATSVYLSTQGRIIGSKCGFGISFEQGKIFIDNMDNVELLQAKENTLQSAYKLAKDKYFPYNTKMMPEEMYNAPQFNTWIQLLYNQNQEDILSYADEILSQGYKPGILMIDDGWSPYYGNWTFDKAKFADAKNMIEILHKKGFKIMLWICPHISPDSLIYRQLANLGYLVKNADDTVAIREWWNGYSAILDMSNPKTKAWIKEQLDYLVNEYGVDGFKFDAGDARFYHDDDITYGSVTPNEQSYLWANFAQEYEFNELRAAMNNGGERLAQRLADKDHRWGKGGIESLIPHHLIQSLFGYAYNCPDMIGGGEYLNFLSNKGKLDPELFVRHAQISCLMPMMQFSAAPWRFLPEEYNKACYKATKVRETFLSDIKFLYEQTAKEGLPITTPIEFYYPHEGLQDEKQAFLLGKNILVVPITEKNVTTQQVSLPKGTWRDLTGAEYIGGQTIEVKVDLDTVLIYKLIS